MKFAQVYHNYNNELNQKGRREGGREGRGGEGRGGGDREGGEGRGGEGRGWGGWGGEHTHYLNSYCCRHQTLAGGHFHKNRVPSTNISNHRVRSTIVYAAQRGVPLAWVYLESGLVHTIST